VWLAKAFGLQINPDGTKDEILPVLIAAEQQGQFKRKDYDKYCYARAELRPDDPPIEVWRGPISVEDTKPSPRSKEAQLAKKIARAPNPGMGEFWNLQQKCKGLGINCAGKNTEWMRNAIAEHAGQAEAEVVDEGVPSEDGDVA